MTPPGAVGRHPPAKWRGLATPTAWNSPSPMTPTFARRARARPTLTARRAGLLPPRAAALTSAGGGGGAGGGQSRNGWEDGRRKRMRAHAMASGCLATVSRWVSNFGPAIDANNSRHPDFRDTRKRWLGRRPPHVHARAGDCVCCGRILARIGRIRQQLCELGCILAESGPIWSKLGGCLGEFHHVWPN